MTQLAKPSFHSQDVRLLGKSTLHQGFMRLVQLQLRFRHFAGGWSETLQREVLERRRVAAVLPFDPKRDQVVLIEQFRIGALAGPDSPWLLELVAGILEDESESLNDLAQREAVEEAGVAVDNLIEICDYWVSPGGTNERVKLFCGQVDASQATGVHGLKSEHEDIKVHVVEAAEAFAAVASGRINNAATIIALQWLQLNHQKIQNDLSGAGFQKGHFNHK